MEKKQMLHIRVGVKIYRWLKEYAKNNSRSITAEAERIFKEKKEGG